MQILVGLAGAGAVLLWSGAELSRFERSVAADISSQLRGEKRAVVVRAVPNGLIGGALGDVESATLNASDFEIDQLPFGAETWRSTSGIIRSLQLNLSNFQIKGIAVESFMARFKNCRYDLPLARRERKIRLSRQVSGEFTMALTQESAKSYIQSKFKDVRSLDMKFDRDYLWIEGFGEFLGLQSQFWIMGRISVLDGSRLIISHAKMNFDGIRAEASAVEEILKVLNPIVEVDGITGTPGVLKVHKVSLGGGKLTVRGTTTIPEVGRASR